MRTLESQYEKNYIHFFNKRIKHYDPSMQIEACYQEIEKAKTISDLTLQTERIQHLYLGMLAATKKLDGLNIEQQFIFKYVYLTCLLLKLRFNHSHFLLHNILESSPEDHLKFKFKELNSLWKSLSPLLKTLYENNLQESLAECIEYNKHYRSSLDKS